MWKYNNEYAPIEWKGGRKGGGKGGERKKKKERKSHFNFLINSLKICILLVIGGVE
jgi:hypothetical protein